MHTNGGRGERTASRRLAFLDLARAHLAEGRVQQALGALQRGARLSSGDPAEEVEFLVPAVNMALVHGHSSLGRAWIRSAQKCIKRLSASNAALARSLSRETELLRLFVAFSERRSPALRARIEQAFSALTGWKPWMLDFRMQVLINEHQLDALEALLRHPPHCRIPRGSAEYARRLLFLALRFSLDGRIRPALIVFESALRKVEEVPPLERWPVRAGTLCWMARAHAHVGGFEEALRLLDEAGNVRYQSPPLKRLLQESYAWIYFRWGDYERALRANLRIWMSCKRRNPVETSFSVTALLRAGRCAVLLDRPEQALRFMSRAVPLARSWPNAWYRATFHLLRGDLKREAGTPGGYRAARKHYDRAEETFQGLGSGELWWLGQVYLSRGILYLKEGKIAEVIEQADLSMELGKRIGTLDAQAGSVLLKSFLLLEEKAPRAQLYDLVLRQLGLVRDPVVLFKVLSNLYMYSWDLGGEHLELTDLHLKQIERLRESMAPRVYAELYRTHVTERVLARFRRRFAGGEHAISS